jgi:2-polyprenyl-3-methyl-5-hydroxy-6-metoxy-1,4-benzoquinol methylase
MNKIDQLPVFEANPLAPAASPMVLPRRRSPPAAVKLLLPVWGYRYVRQFLELGLPTLLAPGNVPAVAAALPCEFILLSSADDEDFIRESSTFKKLSTICHTEIRCIDHLITEGNHSTTITLAYTEVVRSVGDAMLDTCFVFLVSDYIMANGSLRNALARVLNGVSAVLVGNFQIAREDAMPWLEEQLRGPGSALALSSSELMRWALNYLHPTTIANIVNIPLNHNTHTNRLFWRVDGNTLIGRFYLMHMLCVRPEVTDFTVGASCDYSFVPEMCPSGNVEAITDSNEYLAIEMQPREHEAKFLRRGPLKPRAVAKTLSEWTTRSHRDNVRYSVSFHCGELPTNMGAVAAESDAFIQKVARAMKSKPQPHRGHHYWRGAIAAFNEATGKKLNASEWRLALGMPNSARWSSNVLLWHARFWLLGTPPHVYPWHPFWPDFRVIIAELEPFLEDPRKRLLMISNTPTVFTLALADNGERVHRLRSTPFVQSPEERYAPLASRFDLCLLELSEAELSMGDELVDRIVPLMKEDGRILVTTWNRNMGGEFEQSMAIHLPRFIRRGALPKEVRYVPANRLRRMTCRWLARLGNLVNWSPGIGVPCAIVGGTVLVVLSAISNLACLRIKPAIRSGIASSMILGLRIDAIGSRDNHGYSRFQIWLRRRRRELRLSSRPSECPAASKHLAAIAAETGREGHTRSIALKNTIGLASLGVLTNRIWYDDPAQLGLLLARYAFVAKMMKGRLRVAEVGCGDAFGTRVVQQEVGGVTVYDSDYTNIEDVRARQDERWPLQSYVHDIVKRPLPERYDGIYSLGLLEHILPLDEHAFLANLRGSLGPGSTGVVIVGTQPIDSPFLSLRGDSDQLNYKSGSQFRALITQYFTRVFMFSMSHEIVQSGVSPTAHYLFAVCTESK